MNCPHCGNGQHQRAENARPSDRAGVVFRMHQCLTVSCRRLFLSAQLVITDEFEPVSRLDSVLKELMDESDARAQAEIEEAESLEEAASDEE